MDIALRDLTVELGSGDTAVRPIDGFDLDIPSGNLALLIGASGCGKTTLLSVLAGILTPTGGAVTFAGQALGSTSADLLRHRRSTVGVVFQAFNLVPSLTATENVAAPLLAAGVGRRAARQQALALLDQVGLGDRAQHRPGQLSGGQQQRVAIARALAHDPPVLLADEPTAHLDPLQVGGVLVLLRTLAADGRTVVVSTHDDRLRPLADQVVDLSVAGRAPAAAARTKLAKGDVLFEEGTRGHLIYVVESGELEVTRGTGADRVEVARIGRGEHVGDMGALFQRPRSATVTATRATVVTSHSPVQFAALVGNERLDGLELAPRRPAAKRTPVAKKTPVAKRAGTVKQAVAKKAAAKKPAATKRAAG